MVIFPNPHEFHPTGKRWDTKASHKTHAKIFSTNAIWGTTQAEKIGQQQGSMNLPRLRIPST